MEHSPYYCGYCKNDPCQCDGHGKFLDDPRILQMRKELWNRWYKAQKELEKKEQKEGDI